MLDAVGRVFMRFSYVCYSQTSTSLLGVYTVHERKVTTVIKYIVSTRVNNFNYFKLDYKIASYVFNGQPNFRMNAEAPLAQASIKITA